MADVGTLQRPSALVSAFNRAWGFLNRVGIGFDYSYALEVPGRHSGRIRRTPVNLLAYQGERYLVAPRGRTEWVRNAEAAGSVALRRGAKQLTVRLEPVPADASAPILQAYLKTYRGQVQQFFSVPADAPLDAFARVAAQHPAFRVVEVAS